MPPLPRRVTLRDVAREAGVSVASASRAINGSERTVKSDIRERVQAAAARLDYLPDVRAQTVKRGSSSSVGLIVREIADPYFASIASGVLTAAKTAKLTVTIAATDGDAGIELDLLRSMRAQRHRVVIVAGSRLTGADESELTEELSAFERSGGRVVLISQPGLPGCTVSVDDAAGSRDLAVQLVGHGYRGFAVLAGEGSLRSVADRVAGFRQGLSQLGIKIDDRRILRGSFGRDGGYRATMALLARGSAGVELIFATNDLMAIGAMAALRDAGIIPGTEIGVAGFDDIRPALDVTPTLSTVAIPLAEVGATALRAALGTSDRSVLTIVTKTLLRESTPRRRIP